MGGLMCRCGFQYHGVPETGGYWYTAEDQELLLRGFDGDVATAFSHARSVYACPNCAALAVENADGIRYQFFLPEVGPAHVFVDRSQTDALGGYGLDHPRSLKELNEQKILLTPGVAIVAHDDSGWSDICSVEPWVNQDDTLTDGRWVARYPPR